MYEQDYLQRLIRQIGQLSARLLGLRRRQDDVEVQHTADGDPPLDPLTPDALDLVEDAYGAMFGLPRGLLDALDAAGVIRLLSRPDAAIALADLLDTDAAVSERLGLDDRARRRRALAGSIRDLSRAR